MGYRILVAEDEAIIRKGLLMTVDWQAQGCDPPLEAGDGQQALDMIRTHRPDIVLIDINLPIMSGLEVLERSAEEYEYSAIVITGFSEFDYARRAMRCGTSDFLLKPLDFDELYAALENAKLEKRRRQAYRLYEDAQRQLLEVDLFTDLESNSKHHDEDPVVARIIEIMEDNLSDKLTLRDIAASLNYSEAHLIRRFKAVTGTNYGDYLNRTRIHKAVGMLRGGETDLQKLAGDCGFNDYKYFSLVFRKYTGCSPREYIKLVK